MLIDKKGDSFLLSLTFYQFVKLLFVWHRNREHVNSCPLPEKDHILLA